MIDSGADDRSDIPCLAMVANRGYALTSSRRGIIERFLASGWRVVIVSADDPESRSLQELGAILEPISFHRGGLGVSTDIRCYRRLREVYRKWRPDLIHHFHAKPVILGSLAARRELAGHCRIINTITGLGRAFTDGGIAAALAGIGYRLALPRANLTVFQNRDDQALFLEKKWLGQDQARLIASSGVETERFASVDRNARDDSESIVVMIGRLLKQKGIAEFVEIARRVQSQNPGVRFLLAGEEESGHADAVSIQWVQAQTEIEYLGRLADVAPVLARADLFLFPSYYREGVPRVILEAASTGLPAIGFDVPGVREAIRDQETGYLVAPHDIDTMTTRVLALLNNNVLRLQMGDAARKLMRASFSRHSIEERYFDLYHELCPGVSL